MELLLKLKKIACNLCRLAMHMDIFSTPRNPIAVASSKDRDQLNYGRFPSKGIQLHDLQFDCNSELPLTFVDE